jgi:hypothetical protein
MTLQSYSEERFLAVIELAEPSDDGTRLRLAKVILLTWSTLSLS